MFRRVVYGYFLSTVNKVQSPQETRRCLSVQFFLFADDATIAIVFVKNKNISLTPSYDDTFTRHFSNISIGINFILCKILGQIGEKLQLCFILIYSCNRFLLLKKHIMKHTFL